MLFPVHVLNGAAQCMLSNRFVSHNAGPWKPRDPFMGVKAVANQLIALNSSLELVFVWFPGDGAEAACSELKKSTTDRLKVTCYAAPDELPEGCVFPRVFVSHGITVIRREINLAREHCLTTESTIAFMLHVIT